MQSLFETFLPVYWLVIEIAKNRDTFSIIEEIINYNICSILMVIYRSCHVRCIYHYLFSSDQSSAFDVLIWNPRKLKFLGFTSILITVKNIHLHFPTLPLNTNRHQIQEVFDLDRIPQPISYKIPKNY